MIVLCDIDGTLSDHSHRLHHVTNKPRNYEAYYAAMANDFPIVEASAALGKILETPGVSLVLLTGRPERYRSITKDWLRTNFPEIPYHTPIIMRPDGNYAKASIYKETAIFELLKTGEQSFLFIDDDERNTDMYSKYGIFLLAPACWFIIK
jgi:hydroxymethylpyrimidine pyrophosphatase-like HAD family hydrolase